MKTRNIILLTLASASALNNRETSSLENNLVAEYQPGEQKRGVSKFLEWGLAKMETLYGGEIITDLISALLVKCDRILSIMVHSMKDMTLSYTMLHQKEIHRLEDFDKEFKDLVKLKNKVDRKCLYSTSFDDRSVCVHKGIEINSRIQDLRGRRLKSEASIERYNDMIVWCASYKNWFC